MERTHDLNCLNLPSHSPDSEDESPLKSYLWRPGPHVHPLALILEKGETYRHVPDMSFCCKYHMGLGAAVHISSVASPTETWMKSCGVIEQNCQDALGPQFIARAANASLTPLAVLHASMRTFCRHHKSRQKHVAVSSLSPHLQRVVENSVPWVIRANPESFPFLVPLWIKNDTVGGVVKEYASKSLSEACVAKDHHHLRNRT